VKSLIIIVSTLFRFSFFVTGQRDSGFSCPGKGKL
jgi:hypothetical protein